MLCCTYNNTKIINILYYFLIQFFFYSENEDNTSTSRLDMASYVDCKLYFITFIYYNIQDSLTLTKQCASVFIMGRYLFVYPEKFRSPD